MKTNHYIILSLKHSEGKQPCFWRPDDAGYTIYPWAAGIYSKDQIEKQPNYYNDGFNTVAVPLTDDGLNGIGFKCVYDPKKVKP
jgi:hypothetical protein|tara:strand:- start:33 stop:284 length:252 start_codon:yes stop_codon:yes gene_type:complete